jgi:ComF family protein
LVELLYPKLEEFIIDIDLICAVPLYKKRLKKRKYNQALLLAKSIAKKYQIKLIPDLLIRIKGGKYQIGLNKTARINNVKNAFKINDKYLSKIKNKNILIIDDVVTTGATIDNCSKILKKSGCKNVFAAVIAKRILG